jgi:hypothetical protein
MRPYMSRQLLVGISIAITATSFGYSQQDTAKVTLADAIKSKDWIKLSAAWFDESLDVEVRVVGFEKITKGDLYDVFRREYKDDGDFWLLNVEVKNVMKKPASPWKVRSTIRLLGEDGSLFGPLESSELGSDKASGLHRFSGWSDGSPLQPKVPARGAIGFLLPKDGAKYSLTARKTGGNDP